MKGNHRRLAIVARLAGVCVSAACGGVFAAEPGVVSEEYIFEKAPFASCHASTVVETPGGLVAAWFGGTREGAPDVAIWQSRRLGDSWTPPVCVADGVQDDGKRLPCWNPVLFQPKTGPLMLFYKVGPRPASWWGMLRTSDDGGVTWGPGRRLPDGILGPVKNKPIQLGDGTILCPSSSEGGGWRLHFERTSDGGKTWATAAPEMGHGADGATIDAIQPSILTYALGRMQAIGRTRQSHLFETWSNDQGVTWSPLALMTLPNPNSGTDAVTLRDGRQLLVYNHTGCVPGTQKGPRSPLNVAVSRDGVKWEAALVLDDEAGQQFSYPAVIQTSDGLVQIVYTWKRKRIKHVTLDPSKLQTRLMQNGDWPTTAPAKP